MFGQRKFKDFSDELEAHLAHETGRLREEGWREDEARRRAHLNLGNFMNQQERFYESSRWLWLEQLRQDVRQAIRQFRRAPAFTLTAVLTLSLGIGATTAIFTLIHTVLLKSLPVARPAELYAVGDGTHVGVHSGMCEDWDIFPYELYTQLRDHTSGFAELAAFQADPRRIAVRRTGSPQAAESYLAQYGTGNFFSTLGVAALAGRAIESRDDRPDAAPVAMMSYRTWQEKYALDPAVVGATFSLNGIAATIVGVTPPEFFGDTLRSNSPDFWIPVADEPTVNRGGWRNNPNLQWLYLMGRVKRGANVPAMEAQMRVELQQWLQSNPGSRGSSAAAQIPRQTLHLRPGGSGIGLLRTTYSNGLILLMAISAFVLLIVCANLENLMLVRGLARRRQTAISLALGAARWRLIRQALTESVVLALAGGALGIGIAFAGIRTLLAAVFATADHVPISAAPDPVVLGFAFAVSMITGMVFGAAPAWSANRADPLDALRGAGRASESTASLPQRLLVAAQAALCLVLLAAAGLLSQSLRNIEHQRFGFEAAGRMAGRIGPNLAGSKPDQLEPLYRRIRERIGQLPGVTGVSYALYSPMSGSSWSTDVTIEGQAPPSHDGENFTAWNRVGPDYFDTIGTPILRGRGILESDTATTRHVAVINEAFARRFFPNEDPIGKHFSVAAENAKTFEIVGVSVDTKYRQPNQPVTPFYFIPRPQVNQYSDPGTMAFESRSLYVNDIVLRFAGSAEPLQPQIRSVLAGIDPNLTVIRMMTFDTQVATQVTQESLIARLTSLFGLTALILASIGLYGVTSYSVARQSKEIGIRVALGADSPNRLV